MDVDDPSLCTTVRQGVRHLTVPAPNRQPADRLLLHRQESTDCTLTAHLCVCRIYPTAGILASSDEMQT